LNEAQTIPINPWIQTRGGKTTAHGNINPVSGDVQMLLITPLCTQFTDCYKPKKNIIAINKKISNK
jgi:hypothetical protein